MDDDINEGIDYKTFEFVKTLGKGTHGTVILAQQKSSKKKYAIKSIKKQSFDNEKQLSLIKREVEIMANLCHPHIITVHDVCESSSRVTMTLEYASGGELFDYVNDSPGGLGEAESKRIFNQISSAVYYLHKRGVVHRDLKLENILLDCNRDAKIADFGLANSYSRDKLLFTYCGSPLYASPEIVKTEPYFGPEVDCWSLGVILYAMSFGILPFDGSDYGSLKKSIITGNYFIPDVARPALSDLIQRLLEPTTEKRFIMHEVLSHPWLNELDDHDDITSFWSNQKQGAHFSTFYSLHPPPPPRQDCKDASLADYDMHKYNERSNDGDHWKPSCLDFPLESNCKRRLDKNCNDDGPNFHGGDEGNLSFAQRQHDFDPPCVGEVLRYPIAQVEQKKESEFYEFHDHPHHLPFSNSYDLFPKTNASISYDFPDRETYFGGSGWRDSCEDYQYDDLATSGPTICEVKRPKMVSVCGESVIICDNKNSSMSCLGAVDCAPAPRQGRSLGNVAKTKSEPYDLAKSSANGSSDCMFFSYQIETDLRRNGIGLKGRTHFEFGAFRRESGLERSLLGYGGEEEEEVSCYNLEDIETVLDVTGSFLDHAKSKFAAGHLDSLESSDVRIMQLQDNDDNFSIDSLDS